MEPTRTIDTLTRAEDLLNEGRVEQALGTVRHLRGQMLPSSDRGRALAVEVICLEELGKDDDAEELIRELMAEEGDDLAFVLAAGMTFSDLDSFMHAEVFLQNLCAIEPDNAINWFNLAITYGREGRFLEAVRAYDECLKRESVFAQAHLQLAYCHRMLGKLDLAAAAYREYLAFEPNDGEAWKGLAIVESDHGDFDEAYAAFKKAETISDDRIDVYFNWAIAASRKQDPEQLRTCIAQLEDLDPEAWQTLLTRGDQEEGQESIWDAWELHCEALDNLLEVPDHEVDVEWEDAVDYVEVSLLRFARRHDMLDHAQDYIPRILRDGLVTDEVLEALLQLEGRHANQTASHQVVLRGDVRDPETGEVQRRFIVYGISAPNPQDACDEALAFEARCSEDTWEVDSVQQIGTQDEGLVGVYWRSDLMASPPKPFEPAPEPSA